MAPSKANPQVTAATNSTGAQREIVTITADEIPSGRYSLSWETPLYEDYIKARRMYPYSNQPNEANPPYSVEELLMAQQMRMFNGQSVPVAAQDLSDRLKPFSIEDLQYLSLAFVEAYFMEKIDIQSARVIANQLRQSEGLVKTVTSLQLPMRSHTVTFHTPNKGTNMEVERRYQGAQVSGYSLEEYMTAFCIGTVDGSPVEHAKDIISIFDGWPIVDVQFLTLVFVNVFTLDEMGSNKARGLGKRLRQRFGGRSTDTEESDTSPAALVEAKVI